MLKILQQLLIYFDHELQNKLFFLYSLFRDLSKNTLEQLPAGVFRNITRVKAL